MSTIYGEGYVADKGCTRSHPHELMNEECQQLTVAAREAARASLPAPLPDERKLWLWKNFVDGRPEYWAFDNPYPTRLDCGDPQTLGEPCGWAIFKPSRDGSRGRTEESVMQTVMRLSARHGADTYGPDQMIPNPEPLQAARRKPK